MDTLAATTPLRSAAPGSTPAEGAESAGAQVCAAAPRLRADAIRNRERILAAAGELFADEGADVALDEIARRAGVGNATLYRNFPDRNALIHQVALSIMERIRDRAREAVASEGDAFAELCAFVHDAADQKIGALCTMLSEHVTPESEAEYFAIKGDTDELTGLLMARAREAGTLRPDVGPGDLFVALGRLSRPMPGADCVALDHSVTVHRHLQLFLDGLRAPAPSVLPGRPILLEELRRHR
ncbi:TetR/AcrR family transcriptional regulator [Kitasatospora sp. NPDC006697]|uniref:TetR/AcrR family transcriptional regulator n=1 Tax=Kitasatospora sp. NPDC006697 TaxID=3364020 RepID=UPI003689CBBE